MKHSLLKPLFYSGLVGLSIIALSGCGGKSHNGKFNGKFVDDKVVGADWKCSTKSGVTDANGVFGPCPKGSLVTISIGKVILGKVQETKDGIVTPQDIAGVPRTDTSNPLAVKMASLILSLDPDGNPDNGIQILPEIKNVLNDKVGNGGSINNIDVTTVATDVKTAIDSNPTLKATIESKINGSVNMEVKTAAQASAQLDATAQAIENGEITSPPPPTDNATD